MAETRKTCCADQEEESSIKNRPFNLPTWGFLLLLTLVVVVSVALVIIWVMIFPKPFDVDVEYMSASNYRITRARYLSATFNFTIGLNNRNRMLSIYYNWFNVTIERDNQTLAFEEYYKPFAQPPSNKTVLPMSMNSTGNKLNETTLEDLKPTTTGDISIVDIRIMARIQFWTRYWGLTNDHLTGILCSNVRVHPANNTSNSTSTLCRVDL